MTKVSREELLHELETSYRHNGELKTQLELQTLKTEVAVAKKSAADEEVAKLKLEFELYKLTNSDKPSNSIVNTVKRRSKCSSSNRDDADHLLGLEDDSSDEELTPPKRVKKEPIIDFSTLLKDVDEEQLNKLGIDNNPSLKHMTIWCYRNEVPFPEKSRKDEMYNLLSKAYFARINSVPG